MRQLRLLQLGKTLLHRRIQRLVHIGCYHLCLFLIDGVQQLPAILMAIRHHAAYAFHWHAFAHAAIRPISR